MKIFRLVLIFLVILSITSYSYAKGTEITSGRKTKAQAAEPAKAKAKARHVTQEPNMGTKAKRGVGNLLLGWTEIPKSIIQVTKDSRNPIWGITGGTLKGIGKAFPRTVSGAADLVTFPIPDYEKSPVSPAELNTQIK